MSRNHASESTPYVGDVVGHIVSLLYGASSSLTSGASPIAGSDGLASRRQSVADWTSAASETGRGYSKTEMASPGSWLAATVPLRRRATLSVRALIPRTYTCSSPISSVCPTCMSPRLPTTISARRSSTAPETVAPADLSLRQKPQSPAMRTVREPDGNLRPTPPAALARTLQYGRAASWPPVGSALAGWRTYSDALQAVSKTPSRRRLSKGRQGLSTPGRASAAWRSRRRRTAGSRAGRRSDDGSSRRSPVRRSRSETAAARRRRCP